MLAVPNPQHAELLALLDITRGKQANPATKKPAPEYPTAGTGVGVRVYSDRGKRIGPVFSSVEKAQDYASRARYNPTITQLFADVAWWLL